MNITKFVPKSISKGVAKRALALNQQSPTILFSVGIVAALGATVLACRATLKIEERLEETQENIEKTKLAMVEYPEKYSEYDLQRAQAIIYVRGAVELLKLYAPAIGVGIVAIGCLTGSHVVLTNRNAALTLAYAALDKTFRTYRQEVVQEIGPEKEREIAHRVHDRQQIVELDKDGKVIEPPKTPSGYSMYARLFDRDTSVSWDKTPEYNYLFLKAQQNWFNDRLVTRGFVFLNEVYDALGLSRTPEGQLVGWVLGNGDDYIDFGIFKENYHMAVHDHALRGEAIMLDFNVDGTVWDMIGKERC